jgi:methylglyoxal synthase
MKVKVSYSQDLSECQELDLSLATKKGGEWTIGRSPNADLVLEHDDVSRLHGKLFCQGRNYYFSDIGSRNGSIVNNKLAEKHKAYILSNGDIIRIGDFVLKMEEVISFSEQAATVARFIPPSQFANWHSTKDAVNVSVEENKAPDLVSEVTDEVNNQAVNFTNQEGAVLPEVTVNQLETEKEASDIGTETEEAGQGQIDNGEIPKIEDNSNFTYIQPQISNEFAQEKTPENITLENINDGDISEVSEELDNINVNIATASSVSEAEETVSDITSEAVELSNYTIIQPLAIPEQISEEIATSGISDSDEHRQEPLETPLIDRDITSLESEDLNVNNVKYPETTEAFIDNSSTQVIEELEEAAMVSEEINISESESVSVIVEQINPNTEEVSETHSTQLDEDILETNETKYPENLSQKRIILIAHETKKSELVDFVSEHQRFFSLCQTITWSSIRDALQQQVGITISEQISPGTSGGYQNIAGLVSSGDISAVIFLKDFLQSQSGQANEDAMLRLCNINQVLLATNLVTAEAIVHYIIHAQ